MRRKKKRKAQTAEKTFRLSVVLAREVWINKPLHEWSSTQICGLHNSECAKILKTELTEVEVMSVVWTHADYCDSNASIYY